MPEKLLVISDIEGYFKGFVQLLIGNGVIDSNLDWTYGNGHLVLNGDFMDRGTNVTQCLWFIYKLEQEAEQAGGKVHFILGNHELLNLNGTAEYATGKYIELVRRLNISYKALYAVNTEIGRWLRTKNVIEQVGDVLFLHGGISPQVADADLSVERINEICSNNLDTIKDTQAELLMGREGVLWYRSMVSDYKNYNKLTMPQVDNVLKKFNVKAVVVGHTIVDHVSADYGGKVYRTDVKHAEHTPEALLIQDHKFYKTDIYGKLYEL